jgi:hypothetical protein
MDNLDWGYLLITLREILVRVLTSVTGALVTAYILYRYANSKNQSSTHKINSEKNSNKKGWITQVDEPQDIKKNHLTSKAIAQYPNKNQVLLSEKVTITLYNIHIFYFGIPSQRKPITEIIVKLLITILGAIVVPLIISIIFHEPALHTLNDETSNECIECLLRNHENNGDDEDDGDNIESIITVDFTNGIDERWEESQELEISEENGVRMPQTAIDIRRAFLSLNAELAEISNYTIEFEVGVCSTTVNDSYFAIAKFSLGRGLNPPGPVINPGFIFADTISIYNDGIYHQTQSIRTHYRSRVEPLINNVPLFLEKDIFYDIKIIVNNVTKHFSLYINGIRCMKEYHYEYATDSHFAFIFAENSYYIKSFKIYESPLH